MNRNANRLGIRHIQFDAGRIDGVPHGDHRLTGISCADDLQPVGHGQTAVTLNHLRSAVDSRLLDRDIASNENALNIVEGVFASGQYDVGRFDAGADRILATQKLRAVLYRNAFTNKITLERFEYLEE